MANSTPSSVLNELAKSNKVTAHYQVVDESGPPHQKVYTVHLRIGGHGPFEGVGSNLKNARSAAAAKALTEGSPGLRINPTVELNILSMKSGEQVVYRELDSVSFPPRSHVDSVFNSSSYQSILQRSSQHRMNNRVKLWRMSVTICGKTYIGEGHTKPEARGNTASNALIELKPYLIEKAKHLEMERVKQKASLEALGKDAVASVKHSSLVADLYEKANVLKMGVTFITVNESGPSHIPVFRVKCVVGDKETYGEGIGKKSAKNDAADKMLKIIKDIPPPQTKKKERYQKSEKKNVDHGIDVSLDAVTYLTQLMQLRKEAPSVFTLKTDLGPQQKGVTRFQIEASIPGFKAVGYGSQKKNAKTNAATNLLKSLGVDLQAFREAKGIKNKEEKADENLLTTSEKFCKAPGSPISSKISLQRNTHAAMDNTFDSAKQKLDYIARLEGFQLLYNDFVKDFEQIAEFSSNLSIFTTPPELYTGVGDSVDASRENAALKALQSLSLNTEKGDATSNEASK